MFENIKLNFYYEKIIPQGQDFHISSADVVNLTNSNFTSQGITVKFEYQNDIGCSSPAAPIVTETWSW